MTGPVDPLYRYPRRTRRQFWALLALSVLICPAVAAMSSFGSAGACINGCPR